jgi:hypothetical protein
MGRPRVGRVLQAVAIGAVVLLGATACLIPGSDTSAPRAGGAPVIPPGVTDYRTTHPQWLTRNHRDGPIAYEMSPPVGGDHSPVWQDCAGNIYAEPIANEHAVHSLEHGAVWITYRPDLDPRQVRLLVDRVRNRPYLFSSPYPGLDRPISLQAWGYRLQVDSADDPAIDQFIAAYRIVAAPEPGAVCTGGTTATGSLAPAPSASPGASVPPSPTVTPSSSPSPSPSPR